MEKHWTDSAMEQLAEQDRIARLETAQEWLNEERRKWRGGDVESAIEELQSMVRRALDHPKN